MSSVETRCFKEEQKVEILQEFDEVLGLEVEVTHLDSTGDFSITVFGVETNKEFEDILRIEEKFNAYDDSSDYSLPKKERNAS